MREALKLALDWLESGTFVYPTTLSIAIKEALAQPTSGDYALGYAEGFNDACKKPEQDLIPKEDLFVCGQMDAYVTRVYAQPKQEPVIDCPFCLHSFRLRDVYTTPPKRTWVGLTLSDRKEIERCSIYVESAIRLTEAKLKELNK